MIKVNLSALVHASVGRRETIALSLGDISVDDLHLRYLKGRLSFTRIGDGILVEGVLKAEVETECSRCLSSFFLPITLELEDMLLLPGADLTAEHPVRVSEDGWADLAPLIREYVWIEVPVNAVCSPDCRGLCSVCGGNLNLGECTCGESKAVDPRWEVLRALLDVPEEV